ncbi:MAG: amidohydrolase, partial [Cyclobacteriaceae bacterium]|nr:amidohydrolase [Cyclobacteriaceae bacterium]
LPFVISCNNPPTQDSNPEKELGPVKNSIKSTNDHLVSKGNSLVAFRGALLIDGHGGEPLPNACVVVKDNLILSVGKEGDVDIPEGATIIEAKGMTLLPGLIDAHYHNGENINMQNKVLNLGVTSVRDPGAWMQFYQEAMASGEEIPRLFLTGPHLDTYPPAYPHNSYLVNDAEEGRLAVNLFADQGATAIKVYFGLPIGTIKGICEAAHERGIPVTGHLEIAHAMDAINAGLDGIEHITSFGTVLLPMQETQQYKQLVIKNRENRERGRYKAWNSLDLEENFMADSLIQFLADKQTFVCPTLAIFEKQIEEEKGTV